MELSPADEEKNRAGDAQQDCPPTSSLFTQVPLVEEQHCPLQCPAEPGGPA